MDIKEKDVLETIAASGTPAIVATDIKGRITFYSRGAEQLLGFKAEEVLGEKAELFYLKGYSEASAIMKIIRKEERLQKYKTKIITKSKTIVPVLLDVSAVKNEKGELIGTIGIFTSTIEEQKLEEQIRKQERFLAFILLNSAEAIMVLDMEDRILVWNKGAERIFGYTEEEVKGQKYYFLVPPDLEAKGEIQFLSNQMIEKGYINDYVTERICKDGRRIIISLTRSLITDENNKPIGSSTIVRDITYQKKLEKQMVFTEKMATIGKLASSLAHEIGTPLSILMGRAEYLKKIAGNNDEVCRCLDIIIAQAERITKKVSSLLNVARQNKPEITKVSLKSVIFSVLDLLKSKLDKMGIEVVTDFRKEGIVLNADADMMQQVFINLLMNAMDALKKKAKKRIDIIVDVGDYTDQRMVVIEIIDTGCGIPPENINRIFDPFFTTKEKGEGTGLGLSIVARIIQEHKGYIEVQSIVKKGTRFVIKLPLNP
jgi:PAS domain S-box-containing protein